MAKASELVEEAATTYEAAEDAAPCPHYDYSECADCHRKHMAHVVALVLRRAAEAIGAGPAYCEHGTPAADDLRQLATDVEEGR